MIKNAVFRHVNIIARDWELLAQFYEKTFGCERILPGRDMSGKWIEQGTGVDNVHIKGVHLKLPGFNENSPTLEIFQYNHGIENEGKSVNKDGFTHIAFLVEDVEQDLKTVLENGGRELGKVVKKDFEELGVLTFVYAGDPEGNIIELQNWEK